MSNILLRHPVQIIITRFFCNFITGGKSTHAAILMENEVFVTFYELLHINLILIKDILRWLEANECFLRVLLLVITIR